MGSSYRSPRILENQPSAAMTQTVSAPRDNKTNSTLVFYNSAYQTNFGHSPIISARDTGPRNLDTSCRPKETLVLQRKHVELVRVLFCKKMHLNQESKLRNSNNVDLNNREAQVKTAVRPEDRRQTDGDPVALGSYETRTLKASESTTQPKHNTVTPGCSSGTWRLPGKLLFCYDEGMGIPLMVDTGASRSLVPRKFVNSWEDSPIVELQGLVSNTHTLGSIEVQLKLDLPYNPPIRMLVVENLQDFGILGLDFLEQRNLSISTNPLALVQQLNGKIHQLLLLRGRCGLTGSQWQIFQQNHGVKELPLMTGKTDSKKNLCLMTSGNDELTVKCTKLLSQFPCLTEAADYNKPPTHNLVLDIRPVVEEKGVAPFKAYKKRLNKLETEFVREKMMGLVERGVLERTPTSVYTSPISLVPKKNGEFRLCVDYRVFNQRTENLHYPLPSVHSFIETLSVRHKFFSSIDIKDAYYAIPLSRKTADLCGIVVENVGSFKPKRCMFGLKQAPALFQQLADQVIEGLEQFTFVYMDDFLLFSESEEDHLIHLRQLFCRLRKFGLVINVKKCVLGVRSLKFLGFHISDTGAKPLTDRILPLKKLNPPRTVRELRSFLGSINYYHKFIPRLAHILEPLNSKLMGFKAKSRAKITLTEKELRARELAMQAWQKATCLQYEDMSLPLVITTDASLSHCGAVLEQFTSRTEKTVTRPLAYFSSKLPTVVQRRSAFNAELTGLYRALIFFKVRIRNRDLIVRTDHKALINAVQNVTGNHSPSETKMLVFCKEFNPTMVYYKGVSNVVADFLSRPPLLENETTSHDQGLETPRTSDVCLSDDEFMAAEEGSQTPQIDTTFNVTDLEYRKTEILEEMQQEPLEEHLEKDTKMHDGIELYGVVSKDSDNEFRPWIPKSLRVTVWSLLHTITHQGPHSTIETIERTYYWPSLHKDVKEWTKNCPTCQRTKTTRYQKAALSNFPVVDQRLKVLHLDTVGPLTPSEGCRFILTLRDRASGFLWASPLAGKDARTIATAFERTFIAVCGMPARIITDRGLEFCNQLFDAMLIRNGIKHSMTTSYHPQCNGFIERPHRDLKRAINGLNDRSLWARYLPYFLLQMNNLTSDRNCFTAHQRLFGQPASLPGYLVFTPEQLPEIASDEQTQVFQTLMKFHKREARPLKDGRTYIHADLQKCERVYIKNEVRSGANKCAWTGPFLVIEKKEKFFKIDVGNALKNVSIDRIKPAYPLIASKRVNKEENTCNNNGQRYYLRSKPKPAKIIYDAISWTESDTDCSASSDEQDSDCSGSESDGSECSSGISYLFGGRRKWEGFQSDYSDTDEE